MFSNREAFSLCAHTARLKFVCEAVKEKIVINIADYVFHITPIKNMKPLVGNFHVPIWHAEINM